jgi:hypothetical protein
MYFFIPIMVFLSGRISPSSDTYRGDVWTVPRSKIVLIRPHPIILDGFKDELPGRTKTQSAKMKIFVCSNEKNRRRKL